jgi:steroid delta-isomerase-like uncharacterized protein
VTSRNSQTARDQVESFNRRDLDAQVSGYADQFKMTDHARGIALGSKEEVKAWMGDFIAASSDSKVNVIEVVDAGDVVVSVLEMEGTNDGPLGPMPASGRRFSTRGVQILHFDKAGKIIAHDNFFDQLSMMVQLGFAQAPVQS